MGIRRGMVPLEEEKVVACAPQAVEKPRRAIVRGGVECGIGNAIAGPRAWKCVKAHGAGAFFGDDGAFPVVDAQLRDSHRNPLPDKIEFVQE